MPNHVETDLTLKGPKALLDRVFAAHFTPEGTLNCDSVIPYPAEYKQLDEDVAAYDKAHPGDWSGRPKDGFNAGGYEWCCSNWGTKWGTYDGRNVKKGARSIKTTFNSAWSPPTPVINHLATLYPELSIVAKSYECGMAYKIDCRWKGGEQIREEQSDYRGTRGG